MWKPEEQCEGFSVCVEGSVNLSVVLFPHKLFSVLK